MSPQQKKDADCAAMKIKNDARDAAKAANGNSPFLFIQCFFNLSIIYVFAMIIVQFFSIESNLNL